MKGIRLEGTATPHEEADDDVVSLRSQALRSPVERMAILADLVANEGVTEEQRRHYATRLRRESDRLSGLIDNALELQRLEAGRRDLDLGPVDVGSLIRRAVLATGDERLIPIDVQAPDHLPLVWADAEAILEVIANFLDNAGRFSLGGGVITIEARRNGGMVEISVSDHGIGLEAAELPKVFESSTAPRTAFACVALAQGLG